MKRDFRTRLTALLISIVFLPFNVYGLDAKAFIASEDISVSGSSKLELFSFEKADISELETEELIVDLETDPNVEYVQEDFALTPLSYPSDPDFGMQWGLKNIGQNIDSSEGTAGADINVTDVWDGLAPQSGVVVGLLDTGVDIDHPDLQDIVVEGYDFTGLESNILPLDGDPHGTQIAGIIAASHNLEGIAGAAPNVSIMPLKFIENGAGYTSDALNAIEYAKLNGIRVINCSWGSTFYNRALYEAISDNPHILFVCSAGNIDGGQPVYPAAFGLPNILSVSSADNKGLTDINASNGDYVNLYAPGVNIYTTLPGGGDEEEAALQAYIFDFYKLKHPELFEADENGDLTALLISGYTANEIGNAFIFSEVLEIFIEEAINWIDEIRSSAPPEFQYDSSGYDSYLIDKLLWDYGIGQRRIALNAFNVIDVYEAAESLKVYRLTHNMYFDNTVHTFASTTYYSWNKYSSLSVSKYVDGTWNSWVYQGTTSASYAGYSGHLISENSGYINGLPTKTISKSKPGIIYVVNSPTQVTARQIYSTGAMYTTTKKIATSTTYVKGSISYGTVSSASSTAYPRAGHQSGYWYVYLGAATTSVPTINMNTIPNTTVGNTVSVYATSSTPCYRMYASYTVNGGSEVSMDTVYSSVYSRTFQANNPGTYKVTVRSRSYPENDARTAVGTISKSFTVTQPTRMVSYNGNGSTSGSAPASQTWTVGNSLTLRTNSGNLAKSGYVFGGWNTSSNGTGSSYSAGGTYNMGSNSLTLYAKWTASTVTITWNPDGGSVSPTWSSKTANAAFGSLPTPSRSGYTFGGWYTARNGAGTKISTTTLVPRTNTTYYAKWTSKTVTITWNANGGSVSPSSAVKTSGALFGNLPTPTRSGYSFAGWFSSTSFTGSKLTISSTVPASNTTYYAKWESISSTVAVTVTLKHFNGSSWLALLLRTDLYAFNQQYELNAATIFWKLKKQLMSHSAIQSSLIRPTKSSMEDVYRAAIMATSSENKETLWNIFNNRGCAFDRSAPTVNLSRDTNSYIMIASAYDDVAVKKIEWYVDGVLYKTVNNVLSDTINFFQKLSPGEHEIQVRAYDPEGLATGVSIPSRSIRYGSDKKLLKISGVAASNSSAAIGSGFSRGENITTESHVNPTERVVLSEQCLIALDDTKMFEFTVSQCEDVYIYAPVWRAISKIKLYDPEGGLYDEVKYMAPDESYVITNATPGGWEIEIVALTNDELDEITPKSDINVNMIEISTRSSTENLIENQFEIGLENQGEIELVVSTIPTPIEIEWYYDINDPFLLMECLGNEYGAAVYENDIAIDITMPLSEGVHYLTVRREINGQVSEEKQVEVRIDTTAPTIYYRNQSLSTQEEGIFLIGVVSEDTVAVKINSEDYYVSSVSDFGIYIPLEIGLTEVQVELKDSAGNLTFETVGLIRTL